MTELDKKNAMIEWLARKAWKPSRIIEEEYIPANARCYDKKCDSQCWKCWVRAAERAVEKGD